jgi:hypothetical protein
MDKDSKGILESGKGRASWKKCCPRPGYVEGQNWKNSRAGAIGNSM